MLHRCYSDKYKQKNKTYLECFVCDEWLKFSSFDSWFCINYIDGYQLDKDLLSIGNKEYHPSRCIFIPPWLNSFTIACDSSRGEYPVGVSRKSNGRFSSRCRRGGKLINIGTFSNPIDAHIAWRNEKMNQCIAMKDDIDIIDSRIFISLKKLYS